MPSRGSYQLANVVEGRAAERDQSYRSCVSSLLIFCFFCVVLILVNLPWKSYRYYNSEEKDEYINTIQHHIKHETERTTSSMEPIKLLPTTTFVDENNSIEIEIEKHETTESFEVFTGNSSVENETNSNIIDSSKSNIEAVTIDLSQTEIYNEIVTEKLDTSSVININITEDGTSISAEKFQETDTTEATTLVFIDDQEILNEIENSTEANITELIIKEIKKYQEIDTIDKYTVETSTSTFIDYRETPNEVEESIEADITKLAMKEENVTIESITMNQQDVFTYPTILTATSSSPIDKSICLEGECKNLASKILFYMNHTIDPCEDFYEYACGGFEANPQTVEWDLENVAYQRILRQMQKENEENISSLFADYYNSCVQYKNINQTERIKLAREALDKVDKFYTNETWPENHTSFTELLARLLLHNSALLFDVAPDLEEYSPKQFTFRIGPTTYNNPFEIDETNDPCYAKRPKREKETVDLENLYMEYKTCKYDTKKFIESISEALTTLGVFNELNNTFDISQHIKFTLFNIDLQILQGFLANFPSKDKIREAELMKNYTRVSIKQLDENFKIVNWTQLILLLTNGLVEPNTKVQVYFYDALDKGLKSLEKFGQENSMLLHNALLGLYARNLYQELVISKHLDVEKHCLRVAADVLIPEASNLYISSFTKDQLTYMNKTIHGLFKILKETLKLKIMNVTWTTEAGRNALIAKIDDLKVAVPDISYYTDSESTYRKVRANQINLTNNYFENSVILMQRYRKLIYAELFTNPRYPEQIWTRYTTPYQSKGLAIYGLNLVVIPYGVIDWSMKYNESLFNYIKLATLGNMIAHQIAHHFDANGIYYWKGTRDANTLLDDDNSTNMDFKDYIDYQRNILYKDPINMTLSFTGQNVLYKISQLTLNERLSETMGLRLAYDTLAQLRLSESWLYLPWLDLDFTKLFYLIYAQMYCTKSPLTSSYISLYENEQLPNRIRIFVSASNNRLLGEAWNCPEGSQIMPSYVCSAFPYLECIS
ncbi:endothelin-converting enzyme 1-like [Frieseomelitta varia]|uniref:endothelin-converting enzyme 1-like n=1 Tax=Frieseomelitta varia TaxID=561572 RepID=UPI001CB6AE8D|nr:endothelin-converting enzyme 1-like [Frieseomelitta varia]